MAPITPSPTPSADAPAPLPSQPAIPAASYKSSTGTAPRLLYRIPAGFKLQYTASYPECASLGSRGRNEAASSSKRRVAQDSTGGIVFPAFTVAPIGGERDTPPSSPPSSPVRAHRREALRFVDRRRGTYVAPGASVASRASVDASQLIAAALAPVLARLSSTETTIRNLQVQLADGATESARLQMSNLLQSREIAVLQTQVTAKQATLAEHADHIDALQTGQVILAESMCIIRGIDADEADAAEDQTEVDGQPSAKRSRDE